MPALYYCDPQKPQQINDPIDCKFLMEQRGWCALVVGVDKTQQNFWRKHKQKPNSLSELGSPGAHFSEELQGILAGLKTWIWPDREAASIAVVRARKHATKCGELPSLVLCCCTARRTAIETYLREAFASSNKDAAEIHIMWIDQTEYDNLRKNVTATASVMPVGGASDAADKYLGSSPAANEIRGALREVANDRLPVLLFGETGTGKDLAARMIHDLSGRCGQLETLSCRTIPVTLWEAALFGNVPGAYTSATVAKKGAFEVADKRTLFLNEFGKLHKEVQASLLEVLDERTLGRIRPVGAEHTMKVDVKFVGAMVENPAQELEEELLARFPESHRIYFPRLRDRRVDIPELAQAFCTDFCKEFNKPVVELDKEVLATLERFKWKENIRGLRNVVRELVTKIAGGKASVLGKLKKQLATEEKNARGPRYRYISPTKVFGLVPATHHVPVEIQLKKVLDYLENKEQLAKVKDVMDSSAGGCYVKATADMYELCTDKVVLWVGNVQSTSVLLGGSSQNLFLWCEPTFRIANPTIGLPSADLASDPLEIRRAVVALGDYWKERDDPTTAAPQVEDGESKAAMGIIGPRGHERVEECVERGLERWPKLNTRLRRIKVEFCAVVFEARRRGGAGFLLGSPLYVASVDEVAEAAPQNPLPSSDTAADSAGGNPEAACNGRSIEPDAKAQHEGAP